MHYSQYAHRFWGMVNKTEGRCWLWEGMLSWGGYGLLKVSGRKRRAHRISWELHNGPIPPGLLVLHKCDVRHCVRPDHLFLGTDLDNVVDMHIKGRGKAVAKPRNYGAHALVLLDGAGI